MLLVDDRADLQKWGRESCNEMIHATLTSVYSFCVNAEVDSHVSLANEEQIPQ